MNTSTFNLNLAIVIGINEYHNGISALGTAKQDAEAIAAILERDYHYQVKLLTDEQATVKSLKNYLETEIPNILKNVNPSRLVFYFAGHGIALNGDDGPQGYLIPQDAKLGEVTTYLPMQQVESALSSLPCQHCLVILDCCFAGAFRWSSTRKLSVVEETIHKERFDRFIKDPAWQVITSAASDQFALDNLDLNSDRGIAQTDTKHSPFASALVEALRGAADIYPLAKPGKKSGDGIITATELYLYLRDAVEVPTEERNQRQTPQIWSLKKHDKGEFIFLPPGHELNLPPAPSLDELEENNPYRGLKSYDAKDSHLFFGRTALIEKLAEAVENQPLTIVLGASGSGKSSLVKAGLVPYLAPEKWQILSPIRPGESPLNSLNNISQELGENNSSTLIETIPFWFKENSEKKLLFIIDQLEELVTLCRDDLEKQQFLERLAHLLNTYPAQFYLVVTLRSDFEPQLRNTPLESLWQAGRFVVPGMTRDELRSVIEEPASAKVVYFESLENRGYLVDQLIDEVAGMPGALPLLSFALSELYLKLARRYLAAQNQGETVERAIAWSDYDELGGVTKSLTQRADQIYSDLIKTDSAYDKTICYVMLRMVAIGGELARRQVPESEFNYPEPENSRVKTVIQEFLKARLLVSGTDAQNLPYIEPAHDALVRGWERLLSWKQNAEESLILQRRLTPAVEEWDRVQHQYQLSFLDKVNTIFNRVDYLFLPIETVVVRLMNLPADMVKKIQQSSPSQNLLKENPQQFLWNSNPYLEVLKQTIQTQDNWLNKPERTFIQASILQKRRNVSWRWRTAIAIILGLSGLTIAALIGQRNALISQVKASRQAAEANFKANEQLNAFLDSLQAAQSLQSPLLTVFKPDRQLIEDVQGTLQKTIFTTQEKNRWLENSGISRNAVSDDGKWLATATGSQVKLWNCQGQLQTQWNADQDQVLNLQFSPDSQTLVTAGGNNTVRLWSLEGKLITEFLGHTDMVKGVSFSPNGTRLATSGKDMTVRLWTITGKPLAVMPGHTKDVWSVAFSPDGKTLVSVSDDDTMRFWNLQGKLLKIIKAQQQELHTVQFSPNGQYFVTAGKDGTLGLWNQKGDRLATFVGHSGRVWKVVFSPDGQQLASSSADGTVRLWSIKGDSLAVFFGHKGPVRTVNFSLDGQSLVSSGEDSSTRIWDLKSHESSAVKIPFKNPEAIAFSNDGKKLFAAQAKKLYDWDLTTQKSNQVINNLEPIKSLKISNDGQQLMALNANDSLSFWTNKGQLIANKIIANKGNQDFAYSSQQWLATAGEDGVVRVWDQQGKLQKEWRGHLGSVNHLAFSADGQQVVSTGQDSTIRVWNLKSNDAQAIFQLYDALPTFVTFSPDGKFIASGDNSGNIQLWNLPTKQSFATWRAYTNTGIQSLQFDPEGTKLTAIAADGTIKVWPLENLEQLFNRGCQQLQDYLTSSSNSTVNPDLCKTK